MTGEQATSCLRFLESMSEKYKQMATAPSFESEANKVGKPNAARARQIDVDTMNAFADYCAGERISIIAMRIGVSPDALRQRFHTRGLTKRNMQGGQQDGRSSLS